MLMKTVFVKRISTQLLFILSSLMLVSCASTSITDSWLEEENQKSYRHPMIIGISDSQQTRQIFEKHLTSVLKKKNIVATPSYKLINSKQKISRESVLSAIQGTEIDSVLVTYLVSADTKMVPHDSPVNPGYSGNAENHMISDTLVSSRGRSNAAEIISLKNDFYDAQTKKVVWSVQTRTVAPDSIDEVVIAVTELLVNRLLDDGILNE
ncbi:MAG: hypothetical protein COB77_06525 [Gammaproteobacteria bacterium]|nr:MAG: hypothetical protein COB77_06525 [Gammaproteobacteria bacterium]